MRGLREMGDEKLVGFNCWRCGFLLACGTRELGASRHSQAQGAGTGTGRHRNRQAQEQAGTHSPDPACVTPLANQSHRRPARKSVQQDSIRLQRQQIAEGHAPSRHEPRRGPVRRRTRYKRAVGSFASSFEVGLRRPRRLHVTVHAGWSVPRENGEGDTRRACRQRPTPPPLEGPTCDC